MSAERSDWAASHGPRWTVLSPRTTSLQMGRRCFNAAPMRDSERWISSGDPAATTFGAAMMQRFGAFQTAFSEAYAPPELFRIFRPICLTAAIVGVILFPVAYFHSPQIVTDLIQVVVNLRVHGRGGIGRSVIQFPGGAGLSHSTRRSCNEYSSSFWRPLRHGRADDVRDG